MIVHALPRTHTAAPRPSAPPGGDSWGDRVDIGGGAAAGILTLVMAGGAHAFAHTMGSPGLAFGADAFIGASTGFQMAEQLGKSKTAGALIGLGVGAGLAAAGVYGGWPGAFGAAALAAVVRGVVVPRLVQ
ncbi:MAG: hypothetical protein AB7S38_19290 [Vulcanimicrobiota bacterium]